MIQSIISVSDDIDLDIAIEEILDDCNKRLGDTVPQVGILFTSCMDADFVGLLKRIRTKFPDLQLIGCTTDGEITQFTGFIEDSLALLLLSSETVEFSTAVARDISQDTEASFHAALSDARSRMQSEPLCALTFPDGLTSIGTALDVAIQKSFGNLFPVFGGTAGDHFLMTGTYQFHNDQVYCDAAPILLIAGNVKISAAVHKGPVPTGLSYLIGKYEKNIVYEIDGKTAKAFFLEHLGDYQGQITQFPLAVYGKDDVDFFLRDPVFVNDEDESITFVGNFPKECTVRLTLVSRRDVLESSRQANISILNNETGMSPDIIFVFPCTSQRHVLGSKTNEKFSLLQTDERKIPFFGFYCYGEIAPFSIGTPTHFHNDSYVIVALSSVDK